jgi:hypothetical protein
MNQYYQHYPSYPSYNDPTHQLYDNNTNNANNNNHYWQNSRNINKYLLNYRPSLVVSSL